jgi:DNA polymerase-3 subunit delta
MQLYLDKLDSHLKSTLAPVYLISGEVPLLMQEACDKVRKAAVQKGFTDREIFQVETGFNWDLFVEATHTLSLFSNKQLLELRVTNTLTETAGKTLQNYCAQLPQDKILLIITGKLDAKTQKTTWFQAVSKVGVTLAIWPIERQQLPSWVAQRLAQVGLQVESAGIQLLAERAEGNLLACAQEIEKLKLIYDSGQVTAEAIIQAVSDSSRFDVFTFVDAVLAGEKKRLLHIVNGLKNEGVESVLVLWALVRELRNLINIKIDMGTQSGLPSPKILQKYQIWEKRKACVQRALQAHSLQNLQQLLQQAQQIDCMIKGLNKGNVWDALQRLSLAMAGVVL